MIFYHVTAARCLDTIMEEGLRPQVGERSEVMGENIEAIYLFTSREAMEDAVMNWMGDAYEEDDELVVLEVSLEDGFELSGGFEVEAIVKQVIPPERLKVAERLEPPSEMGMGMGAR